MMLQIKVTDEMKQWARDKTSTHKKASMFDEDVNIHDSVFIGYLGEAAFHYQFPDAEHHDASGYDFVHNGNKVEVKSWWTKYSPSFFTSYVQVPIRDSIRSVGRYVFACVKSDYSMVWLVGWIEVDKFKASADRRKKRDSARSMRYTTDCLELLVAYLETFEIPKFNRKRILSTAIL